MNRPSERWFLLPASFWLFALVISVGIFVYPFTIRFPEKQYIVLVRGVLYFGLLMSIVRVLVIRYRFVNCQKPFLPPIKSLLLSLVIVSAIFIASLIACFVTCTIVPGDFGYLGYTNGGWLAGLKIFLGGIAALAVFFFLFLESLRVRV